MQGIGADERMLKRVENEMRETPLNSVQIFL